MYKTVTLEDWKIAIEARKNPMTKQERFNRKLRRFKGEYIPMNAVEKFEAKAKELKNENR